MTDSACVVDVAGVGYLVQASTRTLAALPAPPAFAVVLVETVVREDAILLYGFADTAERDWFRLLTTVQGVGAKVALGLLSALAPRELVSAIASGDRAMLTRSPGVGPKLAVRILSELRERAGTMPTHGVVLSGGGPSGGPSGGAADDALSALVNLGYRRGEAQPAVARALDRLGDAATIDGIIRASLKELAR